MRAIVATVVMLATSCITTGTETCDDATICREGTVCHPVGEGIECVTPDQILACDSLADGAACNGDLGTCFSGACLPAGCGNGRREGAEDCDDGNIAFGDACSPTCKDVRCGNGELDPFVLQNGTPVPLEQCDEGDLRGHDGCSSTCRVELPRWREVSGLPRPRNLAAVSVESDARKIVMFGGFDNDGGAESNDLIQGAGLAETWELSGGAWNLITTIPAPPPRGASAMAFDGTRTIMFGGIPSVGSQALSDTWQYANGAWSMLTPEIVGEPDKIRRYGHAMVFVPGRGIVMFGGGITNAEYSNQTWIFDGTRWELQDLTDNPPERLFHTLTYDPVRDVVVLTGGVPNIKQVTPFRDTWELRTSGWTNVTTSGTGPGVVGAAAVYDRIGNRVVLSGGRTGPNVEDYSISTWFFDGSWTESPALISPRFGVVGAADPESGRPVVFGGRYDAPCGSLPCPTDSDVWSFTNPAATPTWTPRGYIPAPGRSNHAAAFDVDRRRLVVFGGTPGTGGVADNETYEVIEGSWIKPNVVTKPPPRQGAAMAYGRIPGTLTGTLMFGGVFSNAPQQNTWRWDGTSWMEIVGPQPDARRFSDMVFDAGRQRFVLFGGEDIPGPPRNDTWELGPGPSGPEWTQVTTAASPPRRSNFAMAYDPSRAVTWIWGGDGLDAIGEKIELADLWSYDGTTWTEHQTSSGPGARASAKFAYDAGRKAIILFGGGPPATNEAWEWNGQTWSFISTFEVPPTRFDHILYSHPLGGVMAHGGSPAGPTLFSQYRLVRENLEPYAACHAVIDDDADGLAGCDDDDCWTRCRPWCAPGTTCDPTLPSCGDGTCSEPREGCGICPGDCGVCP